MFGIICNARKGRSLGIDVLALVDRTRNKNRWWTSDNPNIAICYTSEPAALFAASRLRKNNVRVVPFSRLKSLLSSQVEAIEEAERDADHQNGMAAVEFGWDGHKNV